VTKVSITLVGYGSIAKSLLARLKTRPSPARIGVRHVVVRGSRVAAVQAELIAAGFVNVQAVSAVPDDARLVLECAGHSALREHVLPALLRGVPCAVVSVGALSEQGLPDALSDAALRGGTQLHLLSGAMGAIDALAAAKQAGLSHVIYTGRKPPQGWRGSPAEAVCNLSALTEATTILQASAREAARLYPKNANVAATVSLAGLGLDDTQVRLIADPSITENIHEVEAVGAFGSFKLEMRGKPLLDNPKTSMLTALSALRFLENLVNPVTM
jgi:aspartate dehydrogenase